ncbi:hypothetical protein GCM10010390_59220 [Streptomyces mordarskii]|uniref:Uncharacterized protein n=1 Tax=Streptomyces mordarskii TaxID=1226758 RepID=A0ABN1DPZ9_9ACTN
MPALRNVPIRAVPVVVTLALVVLLFHGGMDPGWRRFRPNAGAVVACRCRSAEPRLGSGPGCARSSSPLLADCGYDHDKCRRPVWALGEKPLSLIGIRDLRPCPWTLRPCAASSQLVIML